MITPNKIMGAIVYMTREALRNDRKFLDALSCYEYAPSCIYKDLFSFWHYPGTFNEVSSTLLSIKDVKDGDKLKYPALLSFHPIRQEITETTTITYNLAFIGSSLDRWTTEERERETFDLLLRPIYRTFLDQLRKSLYFNLPLSGIPHVMYEVPTTGREKGVLIERYGDCIDAIELHSLKLTLHPNTLCNASRIREIEEKNKLVIDPLI